MAHHASAQKAMRQSLRHRERNKSGLSRLKTQLKRLRAALQAGNAEEARKLFPATVGAVDRAAKQGIIHDNAAARYKSRLNSRLNALKAAAKA